MVSPYISTPASERPRALSVRDLERLYKRGIRLIERPVPEEDLGYGHVKRYKLAQATMLLGVSRQGGHRRAIEHLTKLVSGNLLPDLERRELPGLYRDLYGLGDLAAGERFAWELDRGILCARNTVRATAIYAELRRRYIRRASNGDRSAMLTVARFYANGFGASNHSHINAGQTIELEWRNALAWWGRAAGLRASIESLPTVEDFPTPVDKIASIALCGIADLFEYGKGVGRDVERARRLYRLAATCELPQGQFESARLEMRFYRGWLNSGEREVAERGMKVAYGELEQLGTKGHPPACMELLRWEHWREGSLTGECNILESSFCSHTRSILDDRIRYLGLASEARSVTALRIRAYQLLVRPLSSTECASLRDNPQALIDQIQNIFKAASDAGFIPKPREEQLFEDREKIEEIVRFNANVPRLIYENQSRYIDIANQYWSNFCPINYSRAQAVLFRSLLVEEQLAPTGAVLNWLAIRLKLADLLSDMFAKEWRRTLIVAQLSSTQFAETVQQSVPAWRTGYEQAQKIGGHIRRLYYMRAVAPEVPPERGRRWQIAQREVFKSTQDVGIVYNELHADIGSPIPGARSHDNPLRLTGWQSIDAIRLGVDDYDVIGIRSTEDIPLVTTEDIDVILACQYIDGRDQSLSLEPVGGTFDASVLASQFRRKIWEPAWLSETLLGKSLYYSDCILTPGESGRSMVALRSAIDAALFTAEDTPEWHLPQPWELASQAGGVVTSHGSRVMHTPLAKSWRGVSTPSLATRQSGVGEIPIPQILSGVVGADIHGGRDSAYENRNVGEELLRFYFARVAAVATRHYATLEVAFPVFARTRVLQAVNAGIYSARVRHGVPISDGLRRRVVRKRQEFIEARERRLTRGGLDLVIHE